MENKVFEIAGIVGNLAKQQQNVPIYHAKVLSVNEKNATCDVLYNNIEFKNVRLNAIIQETEIRLLVVPTVGSMVLMMDLSKDLREFCIIKYSAVQKLLFDNGTVQVNVDENVSVINETSKLLIESKGITINAGSGKVSIGNQSNSLLSILSGLIEQISLITVPTEVGPSGVPVNKLMFDIYSKELKALME
ncbi:hypothetical protein N9251_00660 [Gammaproteobacteria bacterium]|nr:hypothetical protein [Gammaproteobacteria bacterium]